MEIWDILDRIGGLCLFLFGMHLMGVALEKTAGGSLKTILARLTTGKLTGFLTGLGVTAIIQSSSATTVMVVGFVNSGLMSLKQAINVIMGANVGTTVTAWLISLAGIDAGGILQWFKPSSFTPILALVGIFLIMATKSSKKHDIATILLGFATLMFGMEAMSAAVSGLKDVPEFTNMLTMFNNPILGVLTGALLTGIIQSSSASVGILQALASTGTVTLGAAIPIIMGQNIGTCVTALISSVGTNRNARRASVVHLFFNIIGTVILLTVFCIAKAFVPAVAEFITGTANEFNIAVAHSTFNILCTMILLPASGLLEKLSYKLIPEPKTQKASKEDAWLDERLMVTPSIAIENCRKASVTMADISVGALKSSLSMLDCKYEPDKATEIRDLEKKADHYEDILGSYLVKLSTHELSSGDSKESSKLLHVIGDFERISDHAVHILASIEELKDKEISFSAAGKREMNSMAAAVNESLDHTVSAFVGDDMEAALRVEPLEQIIDTLKDTLRSRHIERMKKGECTIEAGFVWTDLLGSLERVSDHCSNIASCVIQMSQDKLDVHNYHDYLNKLKVESSEYADMYKSYTEKYLKPIS
ncbi:MAG: Na/Pi cotransporter family protein [Clostridia bacterium]|nr:Na/Pi cotransporter family protein [Clostridia bacterium]